MSAPAPEAIILAIFSPVPVSKKTVRTPEAWARSMIDASARGVGGVGARPEERDLFEAVAAGEIAEGGMAAIEERPGAAGPEPGAEFAVERFERGPVSARPVPESGRAGRIEPGHEIGDEVDDPGVEDGIEPDVRIDAFGPVAMFVGFALRERSERELPSDLEDPQIGPAGPAQEVAGPGLQAAADGNESVEGGELPDIAETRLPGMDLGSRREDEPDVRPVPGDGPGELGQGEDRGHDPEDPPALDGWSRGRDERPAGAEGQDQNGPDLGFLDHAGLPGNARAL